MNYKIGRIGIRFLACLGIDIEFLIVSSPNHHSNPVFPTTKANEVMEKIFIPSEKNELAELIKKLGTEDAALIAAARSLVSEKIEKYTNVAQELTGEGPTQQEEGL